MGGGGVVTELVTFFFSRLVLLKRSGENSDLLLALIIYIEYWFESYGIKQIGNEEGNF